MSRRWRVSVQWSEEFEAEDEGDALLQADMAFSLMSEARADELDNDNED